MSNENGRQLVNSVLRACEIVDCLARESGGPLASSIIAERTGLARPTTHRILATLKESGWVSQTPSAEYKLTTHMYLVGMSVSRDNLLVDVATPTLSRLSDETGDTSYLLVPYKDSVICVQRIEGAYPIRVHYVNPGDTVSPTRGASAALALFGFRPELLDNASPADRQSIGERLSEARERGYVLTRNEMIQGASGVGAPVFDALGQVVAGLSVTGTNERFAGEHLDLVVNAVLHAGTEISALLGHPESLVKLRYVTA